MNLRMDSFLKTFPLRFANGPGNGGHGGSGIRVKKTGIFRDFGTASRPDRGRRSFFIGWKSRFDFILISGAARMKRGASEC
jgi:hypothetical protein